MKLKISILASFLLILGLTSCIDDESSLGGNLLPQLHIAGGEDSEMPVVNFDLGVKCVITPDISYKGGDEKLLTYEWSIGTYEKDYETNKLNKGPLKVVSNERVLSYLFTNGGSYYAHLKVTDGIIGVVQEYQVNINRTFEKGYVLVSNDENNNGNLVFVKDMTSEELLAGKPQVIMEHAIETMNPEISSVKTLLGVSRKVISWPHTVKRLMVTAEDVCYFLDPNRFTVVTDLKYEETVPNFKASLFTPWDQFPYVYDNQMKKFLHFDPEQMYLFENTKFDDVFLDDLFINTKYSEYNGMQGQNYYVDYADSRIGEMGMYSGVFSSTKDGFFKDYDILSVFIGPAYGEFGTQNAVYALVKSKVTANKCVLHKIEGLASGKSEEKVFMASEDMALPKQGTKISFSAKNKRYFYAVDNAVYAYLPNNVECPQKSQYVIQYADNVEISYLDIDPMTDYLYVATYDKNTKRGSFYIYNAKDVSLDNKNTLNPIASHVDCADRITFVMYKPSM